MHVMDHAGECVECGTAVVPEGRVAFGQSSGGVLCTRCRPGKRQVVSVSGAALQVMRRFAQPGDAWRTVAVNRRTGGELRGVLNQYVCNLLGRKPRMHSYLGNLSR